MEESGGFMTLFYLVLNAKKHRLSWIRAGHDPAILCDPVADAFEELHGAGVALGVQPVQKKSCIFVLTG